MDERSLYEANAALERAEAILNSSSDAVILASLEGLIRQTNPAFDAMFGYHVDALYGQSMTLIMAEQSHALLQSALENVGKERGERRLELIAKRRDGSSFAVDVALSYIPSRSEQNLGVVCSIRDMTYRRQIELALQTTAIRLQQLIANLQDGILLEDASRRVELVNDAFCQMFDIDKSSDALVGENCDLMLAASKDVFRDPAGFIDRINQLLADQQIVSHDMLELKDGRIFERDFIPIFVEDQHSANLWQYRDVTERMHSLRRSERLRRIEKLHADIINQFLQMDDVEAALENALALVGEILDVSRAYVFHHRQNERLLDNTHEWCAPGVVPEIDNLKGLPMDELVPSFFPLLAEHGVIQSYDIRELPEDVRALLEPQEIKSILIVPLSVEERIEGFLGFDEVRVNREWQPEEFTILRSLTESYARALERQRAEKALIRLRDDALRAARLRSQFVSNMSHEIRTPMTGILGMLDLLLETTLDEDQKEFAQTAHDSAYHLLDIINSVLDFSKIDSGHVVLESESFNVADLLRDVKSTLDTLAHRNNVKIHIDIGANVPPWLIGDLTRLRQVLLNLAGNAVKFTHDGHVWLRLSKLGSSSQQVRLRFEVEDTGIGIAPEHQRTIFESFVQADGTMVRKYGGTGLGLAIAKQLIELMGGEIDLQSALGHGSTFGFSVTIPYDESLVPEITQTTAIEHWQVVVIDEDDTARYVLAQQVASLGITVHQLSNLFQVGPILARSEQQSSCLILLRLKQPLLPDEHTFLSNLKANNPLALVAVCNAESKSDVDDILFSGCLLRPTYLADLQALFATIEQADAPSPDVLRVDILQPPDVFGKPSYHVLLAEDRSDNQMLIQRILAGMDIQLDIAENGQEAVAMLAEKTYHLVLMDIQMPIMTGIEAIGHIRKVLSLEALPVIAITASVLRHEIESYLAMGFTTVLSKPFSIKQLRQLVAEHLLNPTVDGG